MEKKYYPMENGSIPQLIGGLTKEEIVKAENTSKAFFTFRLLQNKVMEYIENNGIPYTQIVFSPYFEPLISEDNVRNFPTDGDATYNWAYRLDMINEYMLLDLSCIAIINGEDEDLLYLAEHNNFNLDLSPMIVRYELFTKLLNKSNIISHTLPKTFGEYKTSYIKDAVRSLATPPFVTDIIVSEKEKIKSNI